MIQSVVEINQCARKGTEGRIILQQTDTHLAQFPTNVQLYQMPRQPNHQVLSRAGEQSIEAMRRVGMNDERRITNMS